MLEVPQFTRETNLSFLFPCFLHTDQRHIITDPVALRFQRSTLISRPAPGPGARLSEVPASSSRSPTAPENRGQTRQFSRANSPPFRSKRLTGCASVC